MDAAASTVVAAMRRHHVDYHVNCMLVAIGNHATSIYLVGRAYTSALVFNMRHLLVVDQHS